MIVPDDIYETVFVQDLFDKMSKTYSGMNTITSFGFSNRWRGQFLKEIDLSNAGVVVDLMCGMGECWKYIYKTAPHETKIVGLDFSEGMIRLAERNKKQFNEKNIRLLRENLFENSIPDNSASHVISGFGLKTFSEKQLRDLASEVKRILKEEGEFSFIDVSVPRTRGLRFFYMVYLKRIIPFIGKWLLNNSDEYKMLGVYTEKFGNAEQVLRIFKESGLEVEYVEYFFGCASGIRGKKPG